jgi:molybdenum cofactor cytidylyltransferase
MNTGIVILAAGSSERMGAPKQLLPINGISLIKYFIEEAMETLCYPITVVVGAHKARIVPELKDMPISIVDNPSWESGMASSVKMGVVGTYMVSKDIEALIIMTSDMPFVNRHYIKLIRQKGIENPDRDIIASKYSGTFGVPALFRRNILDQLLDLKGDSGAKKVIESNKKKTLFVDFEKGSIDLDTQNDYFNFIQSKN